jgi:hypothetical protein
MIGRTWLQLERISRVSGEDSHATGLRARTWAEGAHGLTVS